MAETLFALVAALLCEAQVYYFSCIRGESALETVDLRSHVLFMSVTRKYKVLSLIAASLMESRENAAQSDFMSAVL